MSEDLEAVAGEISSIADRLGDQIYETVRAQRRGGDEADAAKSLERQLSRARRSLVKAEQILRELSRGE